MALARTYAAVLTGVRAHIIEVEADIASGQPATILTGLTQWQAREASRRIRDAVAGSGGEWPQTKVTVGLSPASLPKLGDATDLAVAAAVAAAAQTVPPGPHDQTLFLAGLGPGGQLNPVNGVLPAALAAADQGLHTIVVAAANRDEAALVPGLRVIAASSLAEVTSWLHGGPEPDPTRPAPAAAATRREPGPAYITGPDQARRGLEICAAGGHNLSLLGPDDSGRAALAEQLAGILPDLDPAAALEVTSVHSVAGNLEPGTGLITRPPFYAPHHTASMAAILGGGSSAGALRPGAAALAHRGVLLIDPAPEFHRDVLDALRQPLEAGEIRIARSGVSAVFPANFITVLATARCPCGGATPPGGRCACSPAVRRRYLDRVSGVLLDRIDVKVALGPAGTDRAPEPRAAVAQRVAAARERAAARFDGTPWRANAEVPGTVLRRGFAPEPGAMRELDRAMELGQVSARAVDKIIRVAWTITDLREKPRPGDAEVSEALSLWLGIPGGPPGAPAASAVPAPAAVPGKEAPPAGQAASRRPPATQTGTRAPRAGRRR